MEVGKELGPLAGLLQVIKLMQIWHGPKVRYV